MQISNKYWKLIEKKAIKKQNNNEQLNKISRGINSVTIRKKNQKSRQYWVFHKINLGYSQSEQEKGIFIDLKI